MSGEWRSGYKNIVSLVLQHGLVWMRLGVQRTGGFINVTQVDEALGPYMNTRVSHIYNLAFNIIIK